MLKCGCKRVTVQYLRGYAIPA